MAKNYYAGNVNCKLQDLDNQEMAEFREQACEIEDWRTVDEIDSEMRARREKVMYRVYLYNVQTTNARCGYGEGRTHQEAIDDAMQIAHNRSVDGTIPCYDTTTNTVCFVGGMNS